MSIINLVYYFALALDVDECLTRPCQNGGTCENLHGSYGCKCKKGFLGKHCEIGRYTLLLPQLLLPGDAKQRRKHAKKSRLIIDSLLVCSAMHPPTTIINNIKELLHFRKGCKWCGK